MDASSTELDRRTRQQEVVAELGRQALETDDVGRLLRDAAVAVAETLDTDHCDVLELLPDGEEALLRAGVGWRDGLVGNAVVPATGDAPAGHALRADDPLVVADLDADEGVDGTTLLEDHGVVSSVGVVVGPADEPWGVLRAHDTEPRAFTEQDANFLRAVANVLGSAIENERAASERGEDADEIYARISDAFFALDDEWRFTYLNDRAHEFINPEGRPLVGEHVWEAFPEATDRAFWAQYERAMHDQETVSFEAYYPDPLDAWFEVRAYPSETGLSVYFRDVTERKERERELRRTERRFEAVFEDPNILVGLLDPDGTVRDVNQTAMDYVDADLEEVVGEPFWETPWWGEGESVRRDAREWTERAAAGEYVEFEADLTRPDGEQYVINGVFRPVTNDDGDVVSVIVSDRDVTERREYERQLAEREQRYRTLAENFPNGVITLFDEDLHYTLAAGQAFEGFPVAAAEVEGSTPAEVWGEDVVGDLVPLMQSALDGEAGSVELSYLGRDWVIHAAPIPDDDGEVFAGMTMAQDITERREYERQLAESEQRYRTLAENFPNGAVGVYDENLRYTLAEGVALGDTLPSAGELEGNRMPDLFPEDVVTDLGPLFRDAVRTGTVGSTTTTIGGRHWRVWAAPLRDGDGETYAGLSFAQDITEQVEREQQLERYETIVETVNDGVYVVDERGDFAMVNDEYAAMLGYAPEELVGTDASRVVVEDEVVERVEEQQRGMLEGTAEPTTVEAELRTASGGTVPVEARFAPLEADAESGWARVGVVRDISERRERERELAESERRYRALVENFPNGSVGLFDEDLRYTAVGGELLDALDLDPEDRLGRSIRELHPAELVDQIEPYFEAAVDGEASSFELEFRGRHLAINTHPIESGDSFTGMIVVQDVTERQEAQRELRESEAKLRMLAENIEEVVWMTTADVEEFVYVNPAFEDIWGIDRERLYEDPTSFLDAVHPEDRDRVREQFERLSEEPFDGEYRIVRPDGELRWIHAKGARVEDADSEMTRVVGTGEDITERKRHEQELERRARQQQVVADLGQFALETDDLDELMHEAARQVGDVLDTDYCKVLDLESADDELLLRQGVGWNDGIAESATVSAVEDDSQAAYTLASASPVVVEDLETEHRFSGPDLLTSHDVRSGISTIIGSVDEPWGILGTHDTEPRTFTEEDVNFVQTVANVLAEAVKRDRYQNELESLVENLEESNERLEQFAYAASHDLQEPLRMVSSYLQLVENRYGDELDEDGREFIEYAVDGADRMRTMIEGLLEYSRVDSRGNPLEPVALDAVLADVLDDLQVRIEETDAEVTHDSLPVVDGDAGQLRQLFQNLLDNAIEYSGDDPPRVELSAERAGDLWRISVRDEGIGIDPADADRVFDVFQRLHTQREHAGTGIGLALCQRIVERHGGDIWVESEPGGGTTFSFTLPPVGAHSA